MTRIGLFGKPWAAHTAVKQLIAATATVRMIIREHDEGGEMGKSLSIMALCAGCDDDIVLS